MKKTKGAIVLLIIAVVVAVFVACSSKPAYTDKEVTLTQAVTDENGQAVTDANGEVVTEQIDAVVVTDSNGQTVTEVVTKSDGTEVTTPNGEKVTQAVTQKVDETNGNSTTDNGDTTKKPSTTKKDDKKPSQTKPNEPTKPRPDADDEVTKPTKPTKPGSTTTTTTTEPTTVPTTAKGEDEDKSDIKVAVVLPFFSDMDANSYHLYVKIGDDTLDFKMTDGCRGQQIEINIPKKYKGKKATFSIDVFGKKYNKEGTIKKGLKIEFETIIVITGEDD